MLNSNIKPGDDVRARQALQKLKKKLGPGASPDFSSLTLSDLTASRLVASNADKLLISSDLASWVTGTANQVVVADDSDGTITLSTPQDIHTGATPTFAGGTFTDVVTGVTPTAGEHLATKEYVDLALGTRDTFFLSDTGSGVGALNYMYQHETTEAESTIVSSALGLGDAQLIKGYITEAGQPNSELINAGVIAFDIHAKKGAANQRATQLYFVLSYVNADGTTGKTTIATSAICSELSEVETICHMHASLAASVEVDITDRIIIDVYANVGAGAQDAVVTLYMEGVHDSHVDFEVSGGVWQNHGYVLDDINTLGQVAADSEFLVGTGAGTFAWETGATLRTSIGVDAAGTASGLVTTHESTYNHSHYNDAYSHVSSDGSSHSIVGSNTTAIGLNTTHRGLTSGNPHSVTPTELSLLIGTNTQAWDAGLDALAALTYVSDSFIKVTATDTYAIRTIAETKTDLSLNNVSNVATDDTAYDAGTWDSNTDAATKNAIRDKVETMDTAIGLNTAKDTNVTTNLSLGAVTATTMIVASSDGTDATLIEADTTNAGLLGSDKWDEIVANSVHTADNSQAHTDYLINNGADSTSGVLTAAGFTVGNLQVTDGVITDATGLSIVAAASITGSLIVDSPTLVVNATGYENKVGVGTATPSELFEVRSTSVSLRALFRADSDSATIKIDSGTGYNASFLFYENQAFRWEITNDGDGGDPMLLHSASGKGIAILQGGNVGIGTKTPGSKLAVVGLPSYANDAAAVVGGLATGDFYSTGGDPDLVCVVS